MTQADLRMKPPMLAVPQDLIERPLTWRKAIILTAELGTRDDAEAAAAMGVPQEMWSRFKTQKNAGINPDRIEAFMDNCGNELLLHNLAWRRGYRMVEIETETQRHLRLAREEIDQLKHDKQVLIDAIRGGR